MAKRVTRSTRIIWGIVVVLIGLMGWYAYRHSTSSDPSAPKQAQYQLEKKGAETVADFSESAKKAHAALDALLAKGGYTAQLLQQEAHTEKQSGVESSIAWHQRQLLVTLAADKAADSIRQQLQQTKLDVPLQVLAAEPDHYQGKEVMRVDLGFSEQVAGKRVQVVTDRLYCRSADNAKGAEQAAVPAKLPPGKAELAIIIDDFGYQYEPIELFAAIHRPLTFAVLPYRDYSLEAAKRGRASGQQIMLHLPLEPLSSSEQMEPTVITTTMSDADIAAYTERAIQAVPGIVGVNNHQGSKATADPRVMKQVMSRIKAAGLFFIDSRTNGQSIAAETAAAAGIPAAANELFIDNQNDVASIKNQLRTAGRQALQHGRFVVIGHARKHTAAALSEMIPELEAEGVRLVFVSTFTH